jgi:type II secretory pathway pseudopilin PulG
VRSMVCQVMGQRGRRTRTDWRCSRSRRGFTLLEMMIAMMTIAAIAIIFAGSVVMAEKAAHVNSQYSQAISLCQHKIDECRAQGYGKLGNYDDMDGIILDVGHPTQPYSFEEIDQVADYLPNPQECSVTITDSATDVRLVKVTVTWKNPRRRNSTVSLSALVANVE